MSHALPKLCPQTPRVSTWENEKLGMNGKFLVANAWLKVLVAWTCFKSHAMGYIMVPIPCLS